MSEKYVHPTLGPMCPTCQSFHGDDACTFDPLAACALCGLPVGVLSLGGPNVCPACDSGVFRDGTRWERPIFSEHVDGGRSLRWLQAEVRQRAGP